MHSGYALSAAQKTRNSNHYPLLNYSTVNLADLPWPPKCAEGSGLTHYRAETKCHICQQEIIVKAELSYIVYDSEANRFVRLCEKCGRGKVA